MTPRAKTSYELDSGHAAWDAPCRAHVYDRADEYAEDANESQP